MISIGSILKTRRGGEPITWTPIPFDSFLPSTISNGGGNWVIGGYRFPYPHNAPGYLATAADPTGAWVTQSYNNATADTTFFVGSHFGRGGVWAIGGGNASLFTSTDPTGLWVERDSGYVPPFRDLAVNTFADDGIDWWIAGGYRGGYLTMTQNPEGPWTVYEVFPTGPEAGPPAADKVIYANGIWVAVGHVANYPHNDRLVILTKVGDPRNLWTRNPAILDNRYGAAIAYGNGIWVIVGYIRTANPYLNQVRIWTANDPAGVWTERDPGFPDIQYLNAIHYANGSWTMVGNRGFIATATDPTGVWNRRVSGLPDSYNYHLQGVSYGDGYWTAVGNNVNPVGNGQIVTAVAGV